MKIPFIASISIGFVLLLAGPSRAGQEERLPFDKILPARTLFYAGVEDCALMAKYAESMPLAKIMQEEEVQAFLKKPKEFVKSMLKELQDKLAEKHEGLAAEIDKLWSLQPTRFLLAFTQLGLPDLTAMKAGTPPVPDVGLVLGIGLDKADPEAILKGLLDALAAEQGFELSYENQEYGSVPYVRITAPMMPQLPVFTFRLSGLFIVSLSENSMKSMIDLAQGKDKQSLASRGDYAKMESAFTLARPGSFQTFMDFHGIFQLLKDVVTLGLSASGDDEFLPKVDGIWQKLGLQGMNIMLSRSLSKDGVARKECFVDRKGPQTGIMNVFPSIPIGKEDLAQVPKEAQTLSFFSFDVPAVYDLVMDIIQSADEEVYKQVQAGLQGFGAMMSAGTEGKPLDLEQDLIATFGKRVFMYTTEGTLSMGAMMPSINFFLEMKDYDRFVATLKQLLKGAESMEPEIADMVQLSTLDYNGQEICYLQSAKLPMVTPCFTRIKNYMVLGMQINDLKKLIKQQEAKQESILDSEDFKKLFAELPAGAPIYSLSYSRTKETFASQYNQLAMVIPMLTMALPPQFELPVDLQLLPTADSIDKYLFSSMTAEVGAGENMSKFVSSGPFGGELVAYGLAGGLAVGLGALKYMETQHGSKVVDVNYDDEKALKDPELMEKKARTDLAGLSNGCFVYKIEFNKFPASLEDLLVPTKDWPNGFYNADKLPKDPWGNDYRYELLDGSGGKYMIWSCGPNGIDEKGKGDDIAKVK